MITVTVNSNRPEAGEFSSGAFLPFAKDATFALLTPTLTSFASLSVLPTEAELRGKKANGDRRATAQSKHK
jgi:hypothetical protein